jgi:hypothetical protein
MSARRCCSGKRCVDGENVHDEETGEKVDRLGAILDDHHPGVVCDGCARAATTAIRYLPHDYADLSKLLVPSGERRFRDPEMPAPTGKPESKLPLRIDVLSLQELIDYEACVWAEAVADHDEVDWDSYAAEHSRPLDRLTRACDLLGYRLQTLLALGPTEHRARSLTERRTDGHDLELTTRSGDDYWTVREGWQAALLLRDLHYRAERACGKGRADNVGIPCPSCHSRNLVREHHNKRVICRSCNVPMPDRDFDILRNTALRLYGLPEIEIDLVVCEHCTSEFNPDSPSRACPFCGTRVQGVAA